MSLKDKVIYFYIKNVKRWMFCPYCYSKKKNSKMHVDKKHDNWVCDDCGYILSCTKFESGITFWFCDGCGTYLNKQPLFTEKNKKWICTECGFDNDVTEANIKNECCGCGKEMPADYKPFYCPECRQKRLEKVADILEATSELCFAISNAIPVNSDLPSYHSGMSVGNYIAELSNVYDQGDAVQKAIMDDAVYKVTGKRLSTLDSTATLCANCGNTNQRTLHDEDDTFYCSKCCHRTRKNDGRDDLVVCPVCHHLKDRKAMYCLWCNNADPNETYDLESEELVNKFESKLTSDNIRYYKLKGKRKI